MANRLLACCLLATPASAFRAGGPVLASAATHHPRAAALLDATIAASPTKTGTVGVVVPTSNTRATPEKVMNAAPVTTAGAVDTALQLLDGDELEAKWDKLRG